jgi:hypothetical protein
MANKSSMTKVIESLKAAFNATRKPIEPLPPQLLVVGANLRPGLSPRKITSNVISRQSEAGAPSGDIFSENSNVTESMTSIMVEEIVNALVLDAKIEIAVPPGVQVTTTGVGNLGGPIISQGVTTNIASGNGVIR